MRIGLLIPTAAPIVTADFLLRAAQGAEERGFDSFWVPEHVVLFDEHRSAYPYSADGRMPDFDASRLGMLEPLSTLCFLAGVTERIRLGTGVCLVPQRNPVYTAKEVVNVDWLSRGRIDFGIGVGWLAEEMAACNVPFARRGARCDSYLEVMRRLWCDEISEYKDEFYTVPPSRCLPKPVQQPHPPIHVGGESPAALRRVARQGQGWFGFNLTPEQVGPHLEQLDRLLAERGRSRRDIQVTIGPYSHAVDRKRLEGYAEAGVDQLVFLFLAAKIDALLKIMDDYARDILEPARTL